MNDIIFTVEPGSETWDYDTPDGMPPVSHVNEYIVRYGKQIVKRFTSEQKAHDYANKMNKKISP